MVNKTKHYLFIKGKLGANTTFDIEQENLIYADCSPTHHGLQCNYVGGTPEYEEIQKLCSQVVDLVKKIDTLNEKILEDLATTNLHSQLDKEFFTSNKEAEKEADRLIFEDGKEIEWDDLKDGDIYETESQGGWVKCKITHHWRGQLMKEILEGNLKGKNWYLFPDLKGFRKIKK